MNFKREFIGEALGTFILVLLGCGSIAVAVLFEALNNLFQIALVWGFGVTLAIFLTHRISGAHLNPAVTLAIIISKRMDFRKLPVYLAGQFFGAFLAGLTIYLLFAGFINQFEAASGILRGSDESMATAKMFGEYYKYPENLAVSMPQAMLAEAFGTFILVLMIFTLTEKITLNRLDKILVPVFIGLTVSTIICVIAPFTQAGINPARDFGPRMVAWIFGWGEAAFPDQSGGFFWVYILAPLIGGALASLFFMKILKPVMNNFRNNNKGK